MTRSAAPASLLLPCLLAACQTAPKDAPAMPQFAILMYESDDAWHHKPQAEKDALLERYMAWIKDLRANGAFKDGSPIGRGGTRLAKDASGAVRATPIDVNAESLTGYFIIEARDLAHAEELARGCPAIGHGETVHVRPVGHE
jgi:hypothetical protein